MGSTWTRCGDSTRSVSVEAMLCSLRKMGTGVYGTRLFPGHHRGMSLLVWILVGMALWHFTVLLPDRFYGGIIGALIAAVAGAVLTGYAFPAPGLPPDNPPGSRRRTGPSPARSRRWAPPAGGAPALNATTPNRRSAHGIPVQVCRRDDSPNSPVRAAGCPSQTTGGSAPSAAGTFARPITRLTARSDGRRARSASVDRQPIPPSDLRCGDAGQHGSPRRRFDQASCSRGAASSAA